MEFVITDNTGKEKKRLLDIGIDVEIGTDNDFELTMYRNELEPYMSFGSMIVSESEFGGIVGDIETDTSKDTILLKGRTWRGMLDKKIIEPQKGMDYRHVSGDLNGILRDIIDPMFDGLIVANKETTGVEVTFQFDRYCTVLSGLIKLLKSVNYKLKIEFISEEIEIGNVIVSAVPVVDYSDTIELSQDSQLDFITKEISNGVNHLICLGKGELRDRTVIHLYVQEDGTVGKTQYYFGVKEVVETYDASNVESDELLVNGTEKLYELMNKKSFSMNTEKLNVNVEIGDIVGGRDYITGFYLQKPVIGKIFTYRNGEETLQYKIEGDE